MTPTKGRVIGEESMAWPTIRKLSCPGAVPSFPVSIYFPRFQASPSWGFLSLPRPLRQIFILLEALAALLADRLRLCRATQRSYVREYLCLPSSLEPPSTLLAFSSGLRGTAHFLGTTGTSTYGARAASTCSVVRPPKTLAGRSRGSLCRNGPQPLSSFLKCGNLMPVLSANS